jgi:iron complex outermembrane receptor protein
VRLALLMSAATAIAIGALPVRAQTADTSGGELQEVVVTGSLIKRTDTESPSPVQVMSAEDIQQSGYTNLAQVLNNISANGANTLSQSFSQAFAAGASGISLRGLTVADTLVLIDGHRTVPYPLDDDNERSFVDTSAIPFNAIERVEVLKDGASAVYGADAIGGVVNIILKKSYVGTEVTAEDGTSQHRDGNTVHASIISGVGDLVADGYNTYIALDFHRQDEILASNRSGLWTTTDWTPYGGVNANPGAIDANVAFPSSTSGYLINPATGNIGAFLGSACNANAQANNLCAYKLPGMQIQPPTEEMNVLAKFTKDLGAGWQLATQASFFNSRAEQVAFNYATTNYPNGQFNIVFTPSDPTPRLVPNPPQVITVPATYPGNPYGVAAPVVYNFSELGQPIVDTNTNTYRFVADVTGQVAGWDLSTSLGIMYSRMIYSLYGNLEWSQLQTALNNGFVLGSSPNPTGTFGPEEQTSPTSTFDYFEANGSKALFDLPGGPLSLAAGIHLHHKVINETAPAAAASGEETESGGPIYVIGTENDEAAFVQLQALPVKGLEADAAVRYDHYNTYGSSTTPKFELKYQPISMVAVRGTWGKGFRAPSAAEAGQSAELFGGGTYQDPVLCPNPTGAEGFNTPGNYPSQCAVGITGVQESNPHLKAVTSTDFTLGVIFEPLKQFNVSVDYYNIKLKNDILSAFEVGGLTDFSQLVRGPQVTIPYVNAEGETVNAKTVTPAGAPTGEALFAVFPYLNAGSTSTSGFDIDLRSYLEVGPVGKLSARLSYTHLIDYSFFALGSTYQLAGTHGPSGISGDTGNPKDRAVLTLGWDKGPAEITATINYTGSFSILDPSAGETSCVGAAFAGFTSAYGERWTGDNSFIDSHCDVASFVDIDVYGRYSISKNLAVHASVLNVANRQPPLDLETYGGGAELAYDQSFEQIGAIGRFYTVGASYKF